MKRTVIHGLLVASCIAFATQSTAFASPPPTMQIFRAELELEVCDLPGAGTPNSLTVQLNNSNRTVLDRPGRDFGRGARRRYDLIHFDAGGLLRVGDITTLRITKNGGSDGISICRLWLFINNRHVFYADYRSRYLYGHSRPGLHLDNDGDGSAAHPRDHRTHTISSLTLRSNPAWLAASPTSWGGFPVPLRAYEVDSRLESLIATFKSKWSDLRWRDSGVIVRRVDDNTWRIRIKLEYYVPTIFLSDADVDIVGDVRISCFRPFLYSSFGRFYFPPQLRFGIENVDVDLDGFYRVLEGDIENMARDATGQLEDVLNQMGSILMAGQRTCPSIRIDTASQLWVVP